MNWIDAAFTWAISWPHWAEYLFGFFVGFGYSILKRDTNDTNWKPQLITWLFLWWAAVILELLGVVWRLMRFVWHPDRGLIAYPIAMLKRAFHVKPLSRASQVIELAPKTPPPAIDTLPLRPPPTQPVLAGKAKVEAVNARKAQTPGA